MIRLLNSNNNKKAFNIKFVFQSSKKKKTVLFFYFIFFYLVVELTGYIYLRVSFFPLLCFFFAGRVSRSSPVPQTKRRAQELAQTQLFTFRSLFLFPSTFFVLICF